MGACCTQVNQKGPQKPKLEKLSSGIVKSQAKCKDMNQQYDIDMKELGEGSFGKVFKAKNKQDPDIQVAIKVINKQKLN